MMNGRYPSYKLSSELPAHNKDVRCVATGPESLKGFRVIFSASADKTAKVWIPEGNFYHEYKIFEDHKDIVTCIIYLPEENWICTGSCDKTLNIYDAESYRSLLTLTGHTGNISSLAGALKSRSIITGSWDKTARIWLIDDDFNYDFLELTGHKSAVWTVATMHKTNNYLTGSADKLLYMWSADAKLIATFAGHTDSVRNILVLPSNTIASCSNDETIRHWSRDGECLRVLRGHANYVNCMTQARGDIGGGDIIFSCGEDSTVRTWSMESGRQCLPPMLLPTQSLWSMTTLYNGDIVTGSNDGIIRVFTKKTERFANQDIMANYEKKVSIKMKEQCNFNISAAAETRLFGESALMQEGYFEGLIMAVRHDDGTVKCYKWQFGKWNLISDVEGVYSNDKKMRHQVAEYDFVLSVFLEDKSTPFKIRYNHNDNPWEVAQNFLQRNNLSSAYLEQVFGLLKCNINALQSSTEIHENLTCTLPEKDEVPPSPDDIQIIDLDKHFPVTHYTVIDNCDTKAVFKKLQEFNEEVEEDLKIPAEELALFFALVADPDDITIQGLDAWSKLKYWPQHLIFPALDIVRLVVRYEDVYRMLKKMDFMDLIIPMLNSSEANQVMMLRILTNMLCHEQGRCDVNDMFFEILDDVEKIRSERPSLQIARASFYLNLSHTQALSSQQDTKITDEATYRQDVDNKERCELITVGICDMITWVRHDEAFYRLLQAIGTLTVTNYRQDLLAIVTLTPSIVDKIREVAANDSPQQEGCSKLNSIAIEILNIISA